MQFQTRQHSIKSRTAIFTDGEQTAWVNIWFNLKEYNAFTLFLYFSRL